MSRVEPSLARQNLTSLGEPESVTYGLSEVTRDVPGAVICLAPNGLSTGSELDLWLAGCLFGQSRLFVC